MDRIAIVGCGGSGKSHLARELGQLLGITPVHLDGVYYDRDWHPLDQEHFAARQRDLVSAPQWIIDGNYASTLPIRLGAADTVVFLDFPARTCLLGIAGRRFRHGHGQHDEDRRLRPHHLELRPLHHRISRADGSSRPGTHRYPRHPRGGGRARHSSRRPAVSRRYGRPRP